jgi:transposase
MAESYAPSVGDVADRYGLAKTQLFTWRREARAKPAPPADPDRLPFAPVIIEPSTPPVAGRPKRSRRRARRGGDSGIELGPVVI